MQISELFKNSNINAPEISSQTDYLIISDRTEVLLPRSEPLRNFKTIQKMKYGMIRLHLVRDLKTCGLLPWDATKQMNIREKKLPEPTDPYKVRVEIRTSVISNPNFSAGTGGGDYKVQLVNSIRS